MRTSSSSRAATTVGRTLRCLSRFNSEERILGDRDYGTVTVQPNSITIGKSRYWDKSVTRSVK